MAFPTKPKSNPKARLPARKHYCVTQGTIPEPPEAKFGRKATTYQKSRAWWIGFGRKSSNFVVWAATAAPKAIPEGGGRSPPPSGMVCWGRRGRPDPLDLRFPAGPKTMYSKPMCNFKPQTRARLGPTRDGALRILISVPPQVCTPGGYRPHPTPSRRVPRC